MPTARDRLPCSGIEPSRRAQGRLRSVRRQPDCGPDNVAGGHGQKTLGLGQIAEVVLKCMETKFPPSAFVWP